MPDNTWDQPSPDGERPDSLEDAAANDMFAAVVLDDAFIEAARIHEPTAAERMLYAVLERAEADMAEAPSSAGDEDPERGFPEDPPEYWLDAAGEPVGFEGSRPDAIDDEHDDADDEGRFDSSDYTRYLPDTWDGSLDEHDGSGCEAAGPPDVAACGHRPPAGERAADTAEWHSEYLRHAARGPGHGGVVRRAVPGPRPAVTLLAGDRPRRWQRPVACVLAVVMGLSVVAFAATAVQRGGSAQRAEPAYQPPGPLPGVLARGGDSGTSAADNRRQNAGGTVHRADPGPDHRPGNGPDGAVPPSPGGAP